MRKPKRRFTVSVEDLEGRLLMSAAPQFTVKPDAGPADFWATGMNDSGQIVGRGPHTAIFTDPNGGAGHTIPGTADFSFVYPTSINDSGQITGYLMNPEHGAVGGGVTHVFLYDSVTGIQRDLGTLYSGLPTSGNSINSSGQISGYGWTQSGGAHAFLSDPNGGTFHDLGTFPLGDSGVRDVSEAMSINNSGQVTGDSSIATPGEMGEPQRHSFFFDPVIGTMRDLGWNGYDSAGASINNSGQIAGYGSIESNGTYIATHAYVSDPNGGSIHDIGALLGNVGQSFAIGINDFGNVVGWSESTNPNGQPESAWEYINGTVYSLDSYNPGNSSTVYYTIAINNSDQILIQYVTANDHIGVLLLTPVPQTPTITWSNPTDIVYGTPITSTQLNATADVPGTFTYNVAEGTVLHAGAAQSLVATFTPTDTNLYTTATANTSINVLKAPLTVTANNATRAWGQPNPPLSGTITGLVNGDTDVATYSTTATTSSPAGTYPITPALTDSNYNITLVSGTLTVAPVTVNTGVSLAYGVVNIQGTLASGNVAEVAIDPTSGNIKVSLNGFTIQYSASSVQQINYVGSMNGHDTYINRTRILSVATMYGGYNTCTSSQGVAYWYLYGTGTSIADDGGTNYVYRHGFAASETGTGTFYNLS